MGRRITFINIFYICLCSLSLLSCAEPLFDAVKNETAASKAAGKKFFPCEACIDRTSVIAVIFDKSMDPTTLTYSGSLASNIRSVSWTKKIHDDDMAIFYPEGNWSADSSLGGATGSLYVTVKDTEGWSCSTIEWKPEILDGVVYVDGENGYDSDTNGGSAQSPFKTIQYAMRAVDDVYSDSNLVSSTKAGIYIAGGQYSSLTDVGAIYITSPLTIRGGYKPGNWAVNDPDVYKTSILGETADAMATFVISGTIEVFLENLTIKNSFDSSTEMSTIVYTSANSTVTIENCTLNSLLSSDEYAEYTNEPVIAKGPLVFDSSSVDMSLPEEGSAVALSLYSVSTIKDSSLTISDPEQGSTDKSVFGIMGRSRTSVTDSTLNILSYGRSAYIEAVTIDTSTNPSLDLSSCTVSGNVITLSGTPEDATGIHCAANSSNNGITVAKNRINNDSQAEVCEGININTFNYAKIYDNAVHGGEGKNVYCVILGSSSYAKIKNNTLFLGSSGKGESGYAYGIFLDKTAEVSFISGNIIFGDNRYNRTYFYRTGIYSTSVNSTVTNLENNVFCNLNGYLLSLKNTTVYAVSSAGLSSMNSCYNNGCNIYYENSGDLHLLDYSESDMLRPTSSTPADIVRSSLDSVPEETDILGSGRTYPYSTGAYETD